MLVTNTVGQDLAGRGKRVASVIVTDIGGASGCSINLRRGGVGGPVLATFGVPSANMTDAWSFSSPLDFSNGGVYVEVATGTPRWSVDLI